MTDRQMYLFDLQGFVVVENVLTAAECEQAISKIKTVMRPMAKTPDGYDPKGTWQSAGNLLDLGDPFTNLIDHPATTSVLENIIGSPLRLESAYSFVRRKGCPVFEMHGGFRGGGPNFHYHVVGNRIWTGLTVISFALQDVSPEAGGFACIPGSHKSDFPVPKEDRKELFAFGGPLVRNVPSPRGSAVIFTETLAHGANSWQLDEPRYGLFYKYNHRACVYHCQEIRRPSAQALALMTPAQRAYFNPAFEAFGPADNPRNLLPTL